MSIQNSVLVILSIFVLGGVSYLIVSNTTLVEEQTLLKAEHTREVAKLLDEARTRDERIELLTANLTELEGELLRIQEEYGNAEEELEAAGIILSALRESYDHTIAEKNTILDELTLEKQKVGAIASQVSELTGAVSTLEKLSTTDEELLAKYSKVYFLNEHYEPTSLGVIPVWYVHSTDKVYLFHTGALPYLKDLLTKATEDGVYLKVISAYRSFDEQTTLKDSYDVVYGEDSANQFSADQGYSEHQLGTSIDFTSTNGTNFDGFEATEAYTWLLNNAHTYGFALSYPETNSYYVFEPWHWRFVGKKLAERLHDQDIYFYDMSQRDIDPYRALIFD